MEIGNFGFSGSGGGGGGLPPIVGGGTLNYIAKYTPNGTTINNSLLFDNGTSVGLGTITPDSSAILELSSTTQGFAAPRMTTLQRDAIVAPVVSLLIFNTSSGFFNYWDGVAWIQMDTSTGGDVSGSGTTNYAVKWTDGANSVIGDGTWAFSGNDYYPVTTGSNIGDATHRIGTIFMASVFDYANNLTFFNGTSTTLTLFTNNTAKFENFVYVGSNITFDGIDTTNYPISIRSSRGDLTRVQNLNTGNTQTDIQIGNNNGANSIYYGVNVLGNSFIDNRTGNLLFQNTGATQMTFDNTGRLGIGITPTYMLDVFSSITNVFRAHGDAISNNSVFSSSNQSVSLTLDTAVSSVLGSVGSSLILNTLGSTKASLVTNSSTSNVTLKSDNGYWLSLVNSTTESIGLGQGGNFMQFNMNGVNNMILVGSTGNLGVGTNSNPTARIYALGVDNTLANYAFKADDSLGNPLLYVRNDAKVSIGKATTLTTLDILGDTTNTLLKLNNANFAFSDKLRIDNNGSFYSGSINAFGGFGTGTYTTDHLNYTLNTSFSTYLAFTNAGGAGNKTSYGIIGGAIGSADSDYRLVILNSDTSTISGSVLKVLSTGASIGNDGFDYYNYGVNINSSGVFTNSGSGTSYKIGLNVNVSNGEVNYAALFNGGNSGFGLSNPTATVHIKGVDATLANYALKVDDSALSPLFYVRNDGVSTFNTSATYATNFGYDVKWQAFANPSSSDGNYISLCTGVGSIFQTAFSRRNGGVVKTEMYFVEANDTTYMAIGVIGDANKALSLRTNDLDRFFISHNGDIGVSKNAMSARFHIFGVDSVNNINLRLEPVTNVTEDTTGNTVITTDATANVTAQTIAIPTNKVVSLESTIVYRKTAGAGVGVIGDGTLIKLNSSVKNVAGVLTLDIVQNTYSGITNAIAGVSANYIVSGTNILVAVTGVLNDDITWNVITKINTVA